MGRRRFLEIPIRQELNAVLRENCIRGQKWNPFKGWLRDEQPIEWILMMMR